MKFGLICGLAVLAGSPALAAGEAIKVSAAAAVRGTTSVVVGVFNVGFIFESVDRTAPTGGLIGAFGGATRAKSQLTGVTPEMMQAITDAAYADFRGQMEARGVTVGDPATLYGHASFAKVKPVASPYEVSVHIDKKATGKVEYYKPSALPGLVMLPGDIQGTGLSSMGMQMAAGMTQYAMAEYAKATGQAVVGLTYLIDFSNVKRPGAFSMAGLKVSSGMSVSPEFSKLSLMTPSGKLAQLVLKQAVIVEGDFATMDDATKDAGLQTAANIAGGVAAVFGAGGMMFGKSRTYAFAVKPDNYTAGAVKVTSLANTTLVDQLAALR
ncbi:hypothetical protein [Sandarakinorhabdus sp. DWP1-3-1]|uniref:hypothetical protein n=1 Tax=Sandarakinorhabdus sp. DWP1-3-1 TaxID=2804627 RepID=UPI003CFAD1DC